MPNPTDLTLPPELLGRLRRCYAEPQRHYHSLAHVEALQRWLAQYRALAREPALIEAAIWFHDAVYDTRRQDNEARSTAMASEELGALGWPPVAAERVATLVLATQHHRAEASDTDAWLFLDLDLSVLGQSTARYTAYADAVRARVLQGFLARDRLYRTPVLHDAWEAPARFNLGAELAELLPAD